VTEPPRFAVSHKNMSKDKSGPPHQEKTVSLAFRDINQITSELLTQIGSPQELDLSNNNITDLSPLRGLTNLETLVLDNNQLTSHCKLPPLPRLHTLWVNKNKIANLTAFIERVEQHAPNLKFLSMLGNEACPNYLNSGTPKQYKDYRLYVISRLKKLEVLDDTYVTAEERQLATKIYGNLPKPVSAEEIQKQSYEERKRRRELREAERKAKKEERMRKIRKERRRKRREEKKLQQKNESVPISTTSSEIALTAENLPVSKLDLPTLDFLEKLNLPTDNENKSSPKESNAHWMKDLPLPQPTVSTQSANATSFQQKKESENSTKPQSATETRHTKEVGVSTLSLPVVPLPLEERTFSSLFTKDSENDNFWNDSDNDNDEWSYSSSGGNSNDSSEWSDSEEENKVAKINNETNR
jgi:hypothetical protein